MKGRLAIVPANDDTIHSLIYVYIYIIFADNICFGAKYNMILYPIEQIPDQGNAQRNKSLRLKRELHWIKTLGTQFPRGMNHKIVRNRDIFITFQFSNNARKAFKITKDIYTKLKTMHPNVFKGELICSFKRNKNLSAYVQYTVIICSL